MSNAFVTCKRHAPEWVESNFRLLMDAAPDAMLVANEAGEIILANLQAERMFGYRREELIGNSIEILVPPSVRAVHAFHRDNFFRDGKPRAMGVGLQLSARRSDGSEFPVEISLSPLATSKATYIAAAIRDVTDRKEAEEKIRRLNLVLETKVADLAAANKELESFSYSISHDLRAPLRQINGFAKILLDEARPLLSPGQCAYLEEIRAGARHLGQLVDDLLRFSQLGRQALRPQPVSMNALVDSVVGEVQLDEQSGRELHWQLDPLPDLVCDSALMRQVFRNLISNAVKFTKNRSVAHIHVGQLETPDGHAFFVRDNGVGFNMKHSNKLFGVFQRLHLQEEFEGTGVGLATVHRIVVKHGGRVWVEAEQDRGATFYFALSSLTTEHNEQ
jgi:PAS domain S-box-containing protein